MIHSIAGELGLNVYIVTLSRAGLDDTSLTQLISNMPRRCIALMEDIDAAFKRGITRDLSAEGHGSPNKGADDAVKKEDDKEEGDEEGPKPFEEADSRVTLSGLLNALDGIGAQEGRLLFATTNNYKALDPALCRPGRMDLHIEFKLSSCYQAESLYKCFYLPDSGDDEETDEGYASARGSVDGEEGDADSEGASASEKTPLLVKSSDDAAPSKTRKHGHTHNLSRDEVLELAARFAEAIPDREFSMASLQGYLMTYKTRPRQAVENALSWVEKERAAKKERS